MDLQQMLNILINEAKKNRGMCADLLGTILMIYNEHSKSDGMKFKIARDEGELADGSDDWDTPTTETQPKATATITKEQVDLAKKMIESENRYPFYQINNAANLLIDAHKLGLI